MFHSRDCTFRLVFSVHLQLSKFYIAHIYRAWTFQEVTHDFMAWDKIILDGERAKNGFSDYKV